VATRPPVFQESFRSL